MKYKIDIVEAHELWVNNIKYDEISNNVVLLGREMQAKIDDDYITVTSTNVFLGHNLTVRLNPVYTLNIHGRK